MHRMTLTQLKYLVALDKFKSFARAAEACLVAQPTLSLQVQKLEQEIGNEIFDRNKNPITTTRFGEKIVEQAKVILREQAKLEELFLSQTEEPQGSLTLAIIPTISSYLLPKIYQSFVTLYPKIDFRIYELPTSQIIEKIEKEEIELGVLATPLHHSTIIEKPLYYEPFVVYFPKDYKGKKKNITIDEISVSEVILLGEEHCLRNQALKICSQKRLGRIECGNIETIKNMVDMGIGFTLLPELSLDKQTESFGTFQKPEPVREISLVYKQGFFKKKMVQVLEKMILSHIPKSLQTRGEGRLIGI